MALSHILVVFSFFITLFVWFRASDEAGYSSAFARTLIYSIVSYRIALKDSHPAKRLRKAASVALTALTEKVTIINVAVPVSAFNRSKGDPPNIIGVVLAVGKSGYTIGTRYNNKR